MIDDEAKDDWMRDWATDPRFLAGMAIGAVIGLPLLGWWIVTHPW